MEINDKLLQEANKAKNNAYAPYSNYKVGASILSESGKIYSSCNVENISFPCGTCAEAGAIASMVAGGDKKISSILIVAEAKELVYPCGACLQRIAEFSDENTIIYLADAKKICKQYYLRELLPQDFTATELKK